ncbi:hypothetical protein JIN77_08810 [Verrucomicrobiaceae bacterium R5-34]|nr:hypothetical protein [Verrucomicrobiaceae bacterium R5-34]
MKFILYVGFVFFAIFASTTVKGNDIINVADQYLGYKIIVVVYSFDQQTGVPIKFECLKGNVKTVPESIKKLVSHPKIDHNSYYSYIIGYNSDEELSSKIGWIRKGNLRSNGRNYKISDVVDNIKIRLKGTSGNK